MKFAGFVFSPIPPLELVRLTSQPSVSMFAESTLKKFIGRWPVALIALGAMLTLVWLALVIWASLHLLLEVV